MSIDLKGTTLSEPIGRVNGQQPIIVESGPNTKKTLATMLVAMDGSSASLTAAKIAMQIAEKVPVSVKGLYIVDERLITNPYANFQQELGFRADPDSRSELVLLFQQRGDSILRWLVDQCRDAQVPVSTEIFFGGVSELVVKKAKQAQLLVLGKKGFGHVADTGYLGRNYRSITNHVTIHLLIGGSRHEPIKRILLAYNSAGSDRALAWAISLQQILICQMIVLIVAEDGSPYKVWTYSIQERLIRSRLQKHSMVSRVGKPADHIFSVAAEHRADLIVMGRHSHAAWLRRLTGSTLGRTLQNSELPVLVA